MARRTSRRHHAPRKLSANALLLANLDDSKSLRSQLAELVAKQLNRANKYHLQMAEAYCDLAGEKTDAGLAGNFRVFELLSKAQFHLGAALGLIESTRELGAMFTSVEETYRDTFASMTARVARVMADAQIISGRIASRPYDY